MFFLLFTVLKLYIEDIYKTAVKLTDRLTVIFTRRVRMKNTKPRS